MNPTTRALPRSGGSPTRSAASASYRLLGSLVWTLGLIVTVAVVLGVMLLVRSAREQDRVVVESSEATFRALMTLQAQRLAGSVRDYSHWDEAVERVPRAYDTTWWEDNAGTFVVDNFGLSFSMAIDGIDRIRLLSVAGEPTRSRLPRTLLPASFRALLRDARERPGWIETGEVATGLVEFGGEIHLAAAAGFAAEFEDSLSNPDPRALLVFAFPVEGGVLADAADIMGVADMRLVDVAPAGGSSYPVVLAGGTTSGAVAWSPPRPGRTLLQGALVPFGAMLAVVVALIGFFVLRARRLAFDLHVHDRTRQQLAARNQSILEAVGEGIFGVDDRGLAVFANPAALSATGYRLDEFIGVDPHPLIGCRIHDEPGEAERCPIQRVLADGRSLATDEGHFVSADGGAFPVEYLVSPVKHAERVIGAVVVFRDITERRRTEAEIRHRANFDGLTDLPNRNLIVERLGQAVARARRAGNHVAVMFLDLDHFKEVNDSLGHEAGDRLLCQAGERLRGCVRASDSVGRLGGDEFVVVLADIGAPRDATIVAEKVLAALAMPFDLGGQQAWIGASVGIALYPGDGDEPRDLVRHADLAMYQAKTEGRHMYRFYRREMTASVMDRRSLEIDLRGALDRDELTLHYQPVVDLIDGGVVHVEALIRWQHPQRGLLPPEAFVPLAEETGLMGEVGKWALNEACRHLAAWRAAGIGVDVAMGVSGRRIAMALSLDVIATALQTHGVAGTSLMFEVDEGMLGARTSPVADWLRGVRELGVRLVLDDVGRAYSSLAHLKRLEVHALKTGRTHVADLLESDEARAVVTAVLTMAERLGVDVVAEGVETEAQAAWLREHGCRLAQGAAFGTPRPADELVDLPRVAGGT